MKTWSVRCVTSCVKEMRSLNINSKLVSFSSLLVWWVFRVHFGVWKIHFRMQLRTIDRCTIAAANLQAGEISLTRNKFRGLILE